MLNCNRLCVGLGGGSLLQIANRAKGQMMSYLIITPDGKTVVIDGGNQSEYDALNSYAELSKLNKKVDLWIMTHAHSDHYGALLWLMKFLPKFDIEIAEMRFNFPAMGQFNIIEQGKKLLVEEFLENLQEKGIKYTPMKKDEVIIVGGMTLEILNDCARYESYEKLTDAQINETSIAFTAHFPKRDVLFLGDLAEEGGKHLLSTCSAEKLRCDIVQMAHHGQDGVDLSFYDVIKPKICLYCAPDWLWDNDSGGGFDSGNWLTLQTRNYMEKLGVQVSCPHAYGDYLLF